MVSNYQYPVHTVLIVVGNSFTFWHYYVDVRRFVKVCESLKEQDYCVDVRAGADAIREMKGK